MNYEDDQEGLFLRNLEGLTIDTLSRCLTGEVDRAEIVALPGLLRELREYRLLNGPLLLQRETSCTCYGAFRKPRGTSQSLPLGQDLLKSLDQKLSARLHEIYRAEEPHGDAPDCSSDITSSQEQGTSSVIMDEKRETGKGQE